MIIIVIAGCSKTGETITEDPPLMSETEKEEDEKNLEPEIETSKTSESEQEKLPDEKQENPEDTKKETDEGSLLQENNAETITEPSKTEEIISETKDEYTSAENQENSEALDTVTLKIEGLADKHLIISLDQLKAMGDMIYEADFYSLNSFGTTGYTHFKGVNLWSLLESNSLISDEASKVTVVAEDGYKMEFTMEQVKRQDYIDETNPDAKYPMIIAWEENGEEYTSKEGSPFKLVVGQKEAGDVNKPQWVSNIDKIVIE
jgi:hypothetical protein